MRVVGAHRFKISGCIVSVAQSSLGSFVVSHSSTMRLWMNGAQQVCRYFMTGPPADPYPYRDIPTADALAASLFSGLCHGCRTEPQTQPSRPAGQLVALRNAASGSRSPALATMSLWKGWGTIGSAAGQGRGTRQGRTERGRCGSPATIVRLGLPARQSPARVPPASDCSSRTLSESV